MSIFVMDWILGTFIYKSMNLASLSSFKRIIDGNHIIVTPPILINDCYFYFVYIKFILTFNYLIVY